MDERTPEEQAVLDELKEERFTDNISSINWAEGYETAPGYNPANRTPKKVNKEKVNNRNHNQKTGKKYNWFTGARVS